MNFIFNYIIIIIFLTPLIVVGQKMNDFHRNIHELAYKNLTEEQLKELDQKKSVVTWAILPIPQREKPGWEGYLKFSYNKRGKLISIPMGKWYHAISTDAGVPLDRYDFYDDVGHFIGHKVYSRSGVLKNQSSVKPANESGYTYVMVDNFYNDNGEVTASYTSFSKKEIDYFEPLKRFKKGKLHFMTTYNILNYFLSKLNMSFLSKYIAFFILIVPFSSMGQKMNSFHKGIHDLAYEKLTEEQLKELDQKKSVITWAIIPNPRGGKLGWEGYLKFSYNKRGKLISIPMGKWYHAISTDAGVPLDRYDFYDDEGRFIGSKVYRKSGSLESQTKIEPAGEPGYTYKMTAISYSETGVPKNSSFSLSKKEIDYFEPFKRFKKWKKNKSAKPEGS